jgi:hypothetical protein
MRTAPLVAAATVGLTTLVAIVVSCSNDKPTCKPGTLALSVLLEGSGVFADPVQVSSVDPALSMTVAHRAGDTSIFDIDVVFPGGYPTDKVATFIVRAYASNALIGESSATVHLAPGCANASIDVVGGNTLDAFGTD